jgi:APA family basic amino acid/polyamine antiporter
VFFCLSSGYLLYSSIMYTGVGALVGIGVLVLGLFVLVISRENPIRVPYKQPN